MDKHFSPSSNESRPQLPASGYTHLHNEIFSNPGSLDHVGSAPLPGASPSLKPGSSQAQKQQWYSGPLTNGHDLSGWPGRGDIESSLPWSEVAMPTTSTMPSFSAIPGTTAMEDTMFANEALGAAIFCGAIQYNAPVEAHGLVADSDTTRVRTSPLPEGNFSQLKGRKGLPRRKSWYARSNGRKRAVPTDIPSSCPSRREVDSLQRWRESPPEDEPASLSAILDALQNAPVRGGLTRGSDTRRSTHRDTSIPSSRGSNDSTSASSAVSAASSQLHFPLSSQSSGRVTKARRSGAQPKNARPFHCTFCCDKFKTKYDWARHEKSIHLTLEAWVCAPEGGTSMSIITSSLQCVYCSVPNPTPEHLETHNHSICQNNTPESRVFRRKDNLVQHLRHVHAINTVPPIDHWKVDGPSITSRCGFCDLKLSSWKERQDHLAGHFRKGCTMAGWKGDHGFEPSVSKLVTNSLPPYLINSESKSLVPFSATSNETKDHFDQIQSRASLVSRQNDRPKPPEVTGPAEPKGLVLHDLPETLSTQAFTEILTRHLGRYAQQQMAQGVIPTDEMFQQESRRLLYDSEDSWNQTVADNAEWLGNFRANHYPNERTEPEPE